MCARHANSCVPKVYRFEQRSRMNEQKDKKVEAYYKEKQLRRNRHSTKVLEIDENIMTNAKEITENVQKECSVFIANFHCLKMNIDIQNTGATQS